MLDQCKNNYKYGFVGLASVALAFDVGKTMESTTPRVEVSQEATMQPAVDSRTSKTK